MSNVPFLQENFGWIFSGAVSLVLVIALARSFRRIPREATGIVERLGRYQKTLTPGVHLLIPLIDQLRPLVDMREQTLTLPPQSVTTNDGLEVSIDAVVHFTITDARAATYEVADYREAIELLLASAVRDVIGGLSREDVLVTRGDIGRQVTASLADATDRLGIRLDRVESSIGR